MKIFQKVALFCSIILFASVFIFGQKRNSQAVNKKENRIETTRETKTKVFSPDNTLVSKKVIQKRNITQYLDGGSLRCGLVASQNECDQRKLDDFIWQCWIEKTRGYITISYSGIDTFNTEHIFIEPNGEKQWQVVRRFENGDVIKNSPAAFSVKQIKNKKNEWNLVFRDASGKVINDF